LHTVDKRIVLWFALFYAAMFLV